MGQLQYIYNTSTSAKFTSLVCQSLDVDVQVESGFSVDNQPSYYATYFCFGNFNDSHNIVARRRGNGIMDLWFYGQHIGDNGTPPNFEYTTGDYLDVVMNVNDYYVNGTPLAVYGTPDPQGTSVSINMDGSLLCHFYYLRLKRNGTLLNEYVAWEENGVVGLKDLVSGTFYQPSSGTWTAGPAYRDDSNVVPINKYKLYTSNIQKTYNGSTQINKMYVGNDLVYRALPTTIAPTPTPTDPDMLHFTAEQVNSTISLIIGSTLSGLVFYKSTDGVNFTSWDGSAVTLSNIGDTLWVYGDNQTLSTGVTTGSFVRFVMTGQIAAAGDVTYLLQNGGLTTLPTVFVFACLFRFNTALISAPALPATTLTERCYQSMFEGCTSLTQAPQLPALVLQEHCYQKMFNECSNLNSVTCLATDISAISCTSNWLNNVAATGTFTKDANMEDWTTGINGIPSGWTVVNY